MGRLIRKPFFGYFAWEWQIGPFVIQYPYSIKRITVWKDPYWK